MPITIILILVIAAFVSGIVLATFVMLIIGIQNGERHMSLLSQPRTRTDLAARRILSAHVRQDITEFEEPRR